MLFLIWLLSSVTRRLQFCTVREWVISIKLMSRIYLTKESRLMEPTFRGIRKPVVQPNKADLLLYIGFFIFSNKTPYIDKKK